MNVQVNRLDRVEQCAWCHWKHNPFLCKKFPQHYLNQMGVTVSECAPGTDECCLMLIIWADIDLIVAIKSINERKYFASSTIINNMVDKGSRIVAFWTRNIDILIIDTQSDGPLFFHNRKDVGNPLSKRNRVNETNTQKKFNFCFNGTNLLRMNMTNVLTYRFQHQGTF